MTRITDTTATGIASLDLISTIIGEINNINKFLNDLGYQGTGQTLTTFSNVGGTSVPPKNYGADDFRIFGGRYVGQLKKTGTHPNVKITMPGRVANGLDFNILTVTPVAGNSISQAAGISLAIISQNTSEVIVKVTTKNTPTQDTSFTVNVIGIATETAATQ